MNTPISILKKYWHYDHFRDMQLEIIESILSGNDTLGVLPTGGGKSICYQIPGLLLDGVCVVVSPLIALMKDQMQGLKERGIACNAIYSGMSVQEVEEEYMLTLDGAYQFLFVSPERLKSRLFLDYFAQWEVGLIAVDEAHCISQWGYDFRPPYLDIAALRDIHEDIPIVALTASATPAVQKDITEKLGFKKRNTFFTTFKRENISFSNFLVEDKVLKLKDILEKVFGCKIVYCNSRASTKMIADYLVFYDISADYYHGGLSTEVREKKQQNWIEGKTNTIVCTNAFGMGIDKADVRCVVHFDVPDTPEAYYQEAGRAGRDGKKSYAVLLYEPSDAEKLRYKVLQKYPPIETIKKIYESLAYYLSIGVGSGFEETFDFDIADFCDKFKHYTIETYSTIKILEQQGFLMLSDSFNVPSKVSVIATKSSIELFEKSFPEYDEILKLLLRTYGGIFNHYIQISEFMMAQHIQVATDYIVHILKMLHQHRMIEYVPRKTFPQLTYLHDRIDIRFLKIDTKLIEILKKRYEERIEFMIDYVQNEKECRNCFLIKYFGEKIEETCGICDVCLAKKKNFGKDEFEEIKNTILQYLSFNKSMMIEDFCKKMNGTQTEKNMHVIKYLLDQEKLCLNDKGQLIIK